MKIIVVDSSLRDGSHAIKHKLNISQIDSYAYFTEKAKIPILEIGHGNGLGASSIQVGESLLSDSKMIKTAKKQIDKTLLCVFSIPGFATKKNIKDAIVSGADIFRIAAHCTEADITEEHIKFVKESGKIAYASLMMTHMASKQTLLKECNKLVNYGAESITIMDSAGSYMPDEVYKRIRFLKNKIDIPLGFHAHNNLGLAIANSLSAVKGGATILDATIWGFGAGAGNAQLEVLIPVLEKNGYYTDIDFYKVLDTCDWAKDELINDIPVVKPLNIISGLSGVFSGFIEHVENAALSYDVDPRDIFFELAQKKVIAGQEDLVIQVALELKREKTRIINDKKGG